MTEMRNGKIDAARFGARPRTLIIFLFAIAGFFALLGSRGLNEPDEGRYASVAANMVRGGSWLIPEFEGHPHLTKPPLSYWFMAGSMTLFGINEWAVRLPSALAGLGVVLMFWSIARIWLRAQASTLVPIMLLCSPFFFVMARLTDPNMMLTFWISLGIWTWERWQLMDRRHLLWLHYAAHAAAFMTKGPVGIFFILLWVLTMGFFARRQKVHVRSIWSWPLFMLSSAVALCWYLIVVAGDPSRLEFFLKGEIVDRISGNNHRRHEPFWFYFAVILGGFLPWIPWLVQSARRTLKGFDTKNPRGQPLGIAILIAIIFFSVIQSKLATYILPLFPWLALFAAHAVNDAGWTRAKRRRACYFAFAIAFIMPAAIVLFGVIRYDWVFESRRLVAALVLSLGASLLISRLNISRLYRLPAVYLIGFCFVLVVLSAKEDQLRGSSSNRMFLREVDVVLKGAAGHLCYIDRPKSWDFYISHLDGKLNVVNYISQPAKEGFESFLNKRPDQSFAVVKKGRLVNAPEPWPSNFVIRVEGTRFALLQKIPREMN